MLQHHKAAGTHAMSANSRRTVAIDFQQMLTRAALPNPLAVMPTWARLGCTCSRGRGKASDRNRWPPRPAGSRSRTLAHDPSDAVDAQLEHLQRISEVAVWESSQLSKHQGLQSSQVPVGIFAIVAFGYEIQLNRSGGQRENPQTAFVGSKWSASGLSERLPQGD